MSCIVVLRKTLREVRFHWKTARRIKVRNCSKGKVIPVQAVEALRVARG
jgi:hypothetical protein